MMSKATEQTNTLVIGASAAGLATAACLKHEAIPFILLEQVEHVAAVWRRHYDRLHLHTNKALSALPYLPMPGDYPKYPSRDQVVAYMETYTRHHGLQPRFGQQVTSVRRENNRWITETQDTRYESAHVIIATGYTRQPNIPVFPGQEAFTGTILHSSQYHNGEPYRGQSVLVIGFGNSGGEIAIDLCEHGAQAAVSVRSPVNVIPRDVFGIPILSIGIAMALLPPRLADVLAAPLMRVLIGDIEKWGLKKLPYGPNQQIRQDSQIPLLDIGTMKLIRAGKIQVFPGIERLTENGVRFTDGREAAFETIVMATGYRPALADFLAEVAQVTNHEGVPLVSGQESPLPGLYFCGFHVSPTGMLREIGIEAKQIAAAIRAKPEG
ncbi:MAG: NAD(P)/FAD-dependent oxidoreductase [Anaerolineaceae bacterium]|nr:NAD(P)/FAD-dependent oxidoreductase [Anaerolineaceae bacterium]